MKRNSDCNPISNTRNLSDFLAQVTTTPIKDKDVSTHKRYRTTPEQLPLGREVNLERRKDKFGSGKKLSNIRQRFGNDLLTTNSNRNFFDKVSPQSKSKFEIKQESDNFTTPNNTPNISELDKCRIESHSILNRTSKELFSLNTSTDIPIKCEITNKSFSEYIGRVNNSYSNISLQTGKDSIGDWIKTTVETLSPSNSNELTESEPATRKRKRKLISEGFAEYIKILSPRLASDVHMWYHNMKQDTHLNGIDRSEVITAFIQSIHLQGSIYNTTCAVIEPVPDKIAENEQFRTCNTITILFTHQTVEMLRIRSNSCVKICPPWTFLLVGHLKSPVILCTYFSFLGDSSQTITNLKLPTPPTCEPVSIWRSSHLRNIHKHNRVVTTACTDTGLQLQLFQYPLTTALATQRWEDLTLAGTIVHVTHAVNPRELSDTQVTEMNLDQHFQIFIRDSNDKVFVVLLPIPIMDSHDSIIKPYQLFNSIVLLKCVKVLSRVNKLTSPHLMSIIRTLSANQRYCYILSGSLNSQIDILKDSSDSTAINPLTELSDYSTAEQRYRISLVGRLQHTQLEVPLSTQDGDIEEHSRPLSGCYLFLLGVNSQLFQVYVEPMLTRSILHTFQESSGRIFYLGSIYISRITERPTRLLADQYCNLIEIENAGWMLGSEMLEKVIDKFSFITPTSYPLFDEYYKVNSMVCVRGSIVDVVEECAYVWQVCGGCGEGVEEYSQGNEFYCDECQTFVTNPIDKFNLDLIIKCNNMEKTQLIVHLHDDTIKKILPQVGEGKLYDKIELKGKDIEMECCFIQEKRLLPCGLTKVYLEENKHISHD